MTETTAREQAQADDTGRAGWSTTLTVTGHHDASPTRTLRRVARAHAEFANALFTTITEADEDGRVVLIADDEPALDRLVDRLRQVLEAAHVGLELVAVERSGPGDD